MRKSRSIVRLTMTSSHNQNTHSKIFLFSYQKNLIHQMNLKNSNINFFFSFSFTRHSRKRLEIVSLLAKRKDEIYPLGPMDYRRAYIYIHASLHLLNRISLTIPSHHHHRVRKYHTRQFHQYRRLNIILIFN
jgi:hypothetical protein